MARKVKLELTGAEALEIWAALEYYEECDPEMDGDRSYWKNGGPAGAASYRAFKRALRKVIEATAPKRRSE